MVAIENRENYLQDSI